ncbi:MAG: hypothetical protein WCY97_07445 [Methanothrix sp.]|uniref:Uncharacterized protein n=1 Tax=Methanothrix harundinacea TaxID=301375 RepID=A0A124FMA6_9EURY|nr:MAG: hypothetical protein XD72_1477 [Methanothrix harundinacea]MDD2638188.1 hypothetical protein [Methanothrix sp.]MDI9398000.1 hypothetical protein [Euryarchaeota archaeon]KUK97305.1 MAG: hypothetical protein XE07_0460 [Methanothrix harundinacea]MDD3709931.1 hypothetical protein [Methanothrix sp.]
MPSKISKSFLFVSLGTIVFRTNWLESYSTRPRWLPSAVPNKTVVEMKRDLRVWGTVLVAIGIFGIMLSGFLDPVWGIVLVIFGASALGIQERSMFIPLGMALLFAGLINLSAGGFGIESIFGLLMIVLGAQEIRTIRTYAAPTAA